MSSDRMTTAIHWHDGRYEKPPDFVRLFVTDGGSMLSARVEAMGPYGEEPLYQITSEYTSPYRFWALVPDSEDLPQYRP